MLTPVIPITARAVVTTSELRGLRVTVPAASLMEIADPSYPDAVGSAVLTAYPPTIRFALRPPPARITVLAGQWSLVGPLLGQVRPKSEIITTSVSSSSVFPAAEPGVAFISP